MRSLCDERRSPLALLVVVGLIGVSALGCASPLFGRDGMFDVDGDRYGNVIDCNDFDPDIHPDAGERCDDAEVDEDCDRRVNDEDDDVQNPTTWFRDDDGDGYGDLGDVQACAPPDGYVAEDGDCDDADASVNPETWLPLYADEDGDGFGDPSRPTSGCERPEGYVDNADDCDDGDPWISPDEEDALVDGIDDDCSGQDGPLMVRVSGGTFEVGCTAGQRNCGSDESPVMPVTLTHDYYIRATEVTQGEYRSVMGSNPSHFVSCGSDCPVEDLTWHEAAAFANVLSREANLTECYECSGSGTSTTCDVDVGPYDCDGYRLPTEAEWEGAARCGTDLTYAGSDTASEVAWYSVNAEDTTHGVAELAPNACGLYDMSGNVYEWVNDWYDGDYYTSGERTDPEGPSSGTLRVLRGGSYNGTATIGELRVSYRHHESPSTDYMDAGFRLARTVP